jgi:hypothetical protein
MRSAPQSVDSGAAKRRDVSDVPHQFRIDFNCFEHEAIEFSMPDPIAIHSAKAARRLPARAVFRPGFPQWIEHESDSPGTLKTRKKCQCNCDHGSNRIASRIVQIGFELAEFPMSPRRRAESRQLAERGNGSGAGKRRGAGSSCAPNPQSAIGFFFSRSQEFHVPQSLSQELRHGMKFPRFAPIE